VKEPDNNVKLIVLESLNDLRKKHDKVLTDLVMDVLRVLSRQVFIYNTARNPLIFTVQSRYRSLP
jgi:hypothetical protein